MSEPGGDGILTKYNIDGPDVLKIIVDLRLIVNPRNTLPCFKAD
mgnify:CR=1 FL=1